ncbi:MAG: BTAD domain-containing putative transcriptional regulator [Gemmatimonadales bacterium]
MIRIQTLGGLGAWQDTRLLGGSAQQPRRLAVLAVLARSGDRGVNRDRLASLLWADGEEERARKSLNQALYALRQELGSEQAILGTRDLRLNAELITVDLEEFETARNAGALEDAARHYAGPFLGDFHLPGAPAFERWVEEERTGLAGEYRAIVQALAAAASRKDDRSSAVYWWRRLAALDPVDPPAALGLMRALAASGDAAGALRHAEVYTRLVREEYDLPVDPDVQALAERIRTGQERPAPAAIVVAPAPAPALPPPVAIADPAPSSSPVVLTPVAPARGRARRWSVAAIGLALAALAVTLVSGYLGARHAGSVPARLAVLPFLNQGDSADAYFADGMTDELRGRLTTIPGLEVVSSLSSNEYRNSGRHLAEIARDLGVGYLLIGKVSWQRGPAGASRVRVSPELIRIAPGAPPTTRWQQAFDTSLTDVFQVQADIAAKVANALDLVLGDSTRRSLGREPTANLAAYDEYLKGEAASQAMKADQAGLRRAIEHYERAVGLDSAYAQSWAQLSRALSSLYSNGVPDQRVGARAREAAERALRLSPSEPLVYLALGDYYESVNPIDNARAVAEYERGLAIAPDRVDLLSAAVMSETSLGRWDGAAARLARASRLDPRSANAARREATVGLFLHDYAAADSAIERAIVLAPTSPAIGALKVMIAMARGDLAGARAATADAARRAGPETIYAFLALYQDLGWVLDDPAQRMVLHMPLSAFDNDRGAWAIMLAELYHVRGDERLARAYADTARQALTEQVRAAPDDGQRRVLLGVALAFLGRKAEAIETARRGAEMRSIQSDAFLGPYVQLQLARVYILTGEPELAMDVLEPLLRVPFYLSPGWLRLDPTFNPLRANPRFRRLAS